MSRSGKKVSLSFWLKCILVGILIGIILVLIPVNMYGLDAGMQIVANYILPAWFISWVVFMSYATYKLYKVKKEKRKIL